VHIVHTESSHGWGGQEIRILSESEGMLARGHRVTLVASASSRVLAEAKRRGIAAAALPIGRKRLRGVLAFRRWLKDHVGSDRVDVINTHSSTDSWIAALACSTMKRPPPIVRTRHVSVPVANNAATRWLYTGPTRRIVTTGEQLRRQLIEENRYPPDRITSVPTGIDASRFAPGDRATARAATGLPAEATLIGIVATLRSWKGHRFLIEAFTRVEGEGLGLVIVGGGPQRAALDTLVASLGLGDRVRIVGDQDDVLPWLQSLDVFALPSYANEGVPQALVQAMLCGLACVTTGVGAIPEAARDGETALVVPAQDVDALAAALARLTADPALRRRLGAAARELCIRQFGYDVMLDRMEAVFRDAVAAR
jgi:glycosyltransferase involved in cell wall biosynthesis